ncbi:hypothetical protein EAH73_00030 [Hymenobacter nivis]|uniref:Uncharacterized protein n=1 Tax=Hymenobacter nivis TaxID=1850093 RepID=A0A502HEQ2_9BACT|nr:hypothetical protein EAH73_00030 [Hymenobacter nivis]
MAVSGACTTPASVPAMPSTMKCTSGICTRPLMFSSLAKKNPARAPENSDEPNMPPLPPAPTVMLVATTLSSRLKSTSTSSSQGLWSPYTEKMLPSVSWPDLPASSSSTVL